MLFTQLFIIEEDSNASASLSTEAVSGKCIKAAHTPTSSIHGSRTSLISVHYSRNGPSYPKLYLTCGAFTPDPVFHQPGPKYDFRSQMLEEVLAKHYWWHGRAPQPLDGGRAGWHKLPLLGIAALEQHTACCGVCQHPCDYNRNPAQFCLHCARCNTDFPKCGVFVRNWVLGLGFLQQLLFPTVHINNLNISAPFILQLH